MLRRPLLPHRAWHDRGGNGYSDTAPYTKCVQTCIETLRIPAAETRRNLSVVYIQQGVFRSSYYLLFYIIFTNSKLLVPRAPRNPLEFTFKFGILPFYTLKSSFYFIMILSFIEYAFKFFLGQNMP